MKYLDRIEHITILGGLRTIQSWCENVVCEYNYSLDVREEVPQEYPSISVQASTRRGCT